jgi:hypothetical protein
MKAMLSVCVDIDICAKLKKINNKSNLVNSLLKEFFKSPIERMSDEEFNKYLKETN